MRRSLLLVGLVLTGCGDLLFDEVLMSAPAPVAMAQSNPSQPSNEPRTRQEFLAFLGQAGVQLSPQDQALIMRYMSVRAIGQWSGGPMGNPLANLQRHFAKSGPAMQPPVRTPQEFTQRAMAFVTRTGVSYYLDLDFYRQRRQVSVVMWDAASREFAVVGLNGELVAYMRRDDVRAGKFVKVPPDMGSGASSAVQPQQTGAPVRPPVQTGAPVRPPIRR